MYQLQTHGSLNPHFRALSPGSPGPSLRLPQAGPLLPADGRSLLTSGAAEVVGIICLTILAVARCTSSPYLLVQAPLAGPCSVGVDGVGYWVGPEEQQVSPPCEISAEEPR